MDKFNLEPSQVDITISYQGSNFDSGGRAPRTEKNLISALHKLGVEIQNNFGDESLETAQEIINSMGPNKIIVGGSINGEVSRELEKPSGGLEAELEGLGAGAAIKKIATHIDEIEKDLAYLKSGLGI